MAATTNTNLYFHQIKAKAKQTQLTGEERV